MASLATSPAVVAIFRALIEERTGLHYGSGEQELLMDKAADRALEAGFDSLLDYYYYLRYDPHADVELDKLIDALVVGETYFFREFDQLRTVVSHFLEPAIRTGHRPRLWSAACASGEEPLSVAALLADRELLSAVDLVASDISLCALERAKAGSFGKRSLRSLPDRALARRFLGEEQNGLWRIAPELLRAIEWRRVNLTVAHEITCMGQFDVILCRNVLIYFSDETVARIVNSLTTRLRPGGALFVSVSESLMRFGTSLVCEERDGVFFYRRAD
jgi:chemotaxis protein methyltransferase CheR